jgi:hypothetical protein
VEVDLNLERAAVKQAEIDDLLVLLEEKKDLKYEKSLVARQLLRAQATTARLLRPPNLPLSYPCPTLAHTPTLAHLRTGLECRHEGEA